MRTSGLSSRARATSSFARVMSALTVSWNTGACHAAVSRRAIVLRIDVSGTDSISPAGTAAGAAAGAGDRAALDVLGDDPALGPRAGQRMQVDAALARDPARKRRRLDAAAVGSAAAVGNGSTGDSANLVRLGNVAVGLRRRFGAARGLGLTSSPASPIHAIVWPTGASPSSRAIFSSTPREVRLDLLRHLVGVDLEERLALLRPCHLRTSATCDRSGLHALAEARQLDLVGHAGLLPDGPPDRREHVVRRSARRTAPSPARTRAARTSRRRARSARRASRTPCTAARPPPRRRSPCASPPRARRRRGSSSSRSRRARPRRAAAACAGRPPRRRCRPPRRASAASSERCTSGPVAITVTSVPSRSVRALPSGIGSSSSGTSPLTG